MVEDRENKYRLISKEDPPQFLGHVNTPFDSVPDLVEFNQKAYNRILSALEEVSKAKGAAGSTQGVLVLGEPGSGKTHLLMRVAQTLSRKNHVLFVSKPTNRHAVAQHIWSSILSSLSHTLPSGNGRSQLDDLLAHVFRKILVPILEKDIKAGRDAKVKKVQVERLSKNAYNLFDMLGTGEKRERNYKALCQSTRNYLRIHHPDIDHEIGDALIKYCLVDDNRKPALLSWLSGLDLDEEEANDLKFPQSWASLETSVDNLDVHNKREVRAFKAIVTIATLSTHYQPLILAFDQLEGLRGQEAITLAWADKVREMFTQAPNMLIVTCMFPSLWQDWFGKFFAGRPEWQSAKERINGRNAPLDEFTATHAVALLAGRLRPSFARHRLPTNIYPFTEDDIAAICDESTSPRTFLNIAGELFESWAEGEVSTGTLTTVVTRDAIDKMLHSKLVEYRTNFKDGPAERCIPNEQAFIGQLQDVFELVLANSDETATFHEIEVGKKAIPSNFVVQAPKSPTLWMAVCNAEGGGFAAGVKNFVKEFRAGRVGGAILLRDQRYRDAVGVTANHIHDYTHSRGGYLQLVRSEFGLVVSIHKVMGDVEEHDLIIGTYKIDKLDFVQFLREKLIARESVLFKMAAERFPPLGRALNIESKRQIS